MAGNTNFLKWDWAGSHVQVELENGEYVSAESTLILAGPSELSLITGGDVTGSEGQLYPLGLIQNIQIAQNRQVARLFEIGSKRSYFVPGRLFANFQMNRILFYGPSLMRLLYAAAPTNEEGHTFTFDKPLGSTEKQFNTTTAGANSEYAKLFPNRYSLSPGKGGEQEGDNRDFWINLASEVFNVPMGLVLLFKDARQRAYGAFYMENCMIEAHSLGVDSNNVVLAEGVNGQFDMIRPISVRQLPAAAGT